VGALQRATVGQPVRMLQRAGLRDGARVLDAGAGGGRLVAALRRAGYDASGIEPSARSAARAEAAGLPVARESIEEHESSGLDAVVLWHVLEHMDDPAAALTRVSGWLAPGGVVLVGVPNIASLQARIGRGGWLHLDAPRHRVHLTPAGVAALFAQADLTPRRSTHMVWEHNPAGMWMALLARLGMTPGFPFHLLKRNVPARPKDLALLAAGVPLAPLALALEAGAAGARRGGTIAALARRPR
jgi:SAM-dependent methyltransferase